MTFTRFCVALAALILWGCEPADQAQVEKEGQVRQYYIAADPVVWDYAPQGRNLVMDREYVLQAGKRKFRKVKGA